MAPPDQLAPAYSISQLEPLLLFFFLDPTSSLHIATLLGSFYSKSIYFLSAFFLLSETEDQEEFTQLVSADCFFFLSIIMNEPRLIEVHIEFQYVLIEEKKKVLNLEHLN